MREGWQTKKLREVCELVNGRAYSKPELLAAGKYRVLRVGNFFTNDHWYYSDMELEEKKYCDNGDLLYAWSASFGPRIWTGGKVIYHYHIWKVVHDCTQIDQMFLFYFFQWDTEKIKEDQGTGTTMMHVSMGSMSERDIHLPPLPEQQRIVALLDEAFAGLATAKANDERNLQNARAIFESYLQSVFRQRGEGWVKTDVQSIAKPGKGKIRTGPFGSQLLHSEFVDEGIAVLGIDNAVANHFQWGKSRFITPEKYQQLERYTVYPGDVLITIMGTCGRCAVVPDDIPLAINTKHICCITLDRGQCLPGYLHIYFLHAPQSQEYLAKYAKGAIMAGLNMGLIQDLPVSLPPLQVQEELIGVADDLREETQRLSRLYERKLAALEELKKALLHQAFNGEL